MAHLATLIFISVLGPATYATVDARDDHARGAFLGLMYGDALGSPTESFSAEQIREVFGEHRSLTEPSPLGKIRFTRGKRGLRRTRIRGFVSDDGQQAMALLLAVAQNPQWGARGITFFKRTMIDMYRARAHRGVGKMFVKAVKRLSKGVDPHRSGSYSSGIGAAMRVGGVAGFKDIDVDALNEAVASTSLMTHADLRATALAMAVLLVNRSLIEGLPVTSTREHLAMFVRDLEEHLSRTERYVFDRREPFALSDALREVLARVPEAQSNDEISELVVRVGARSLDPKHGGRPHPNSGYALLGGIHAIALALRPNAEPMDVLRYVVNLGDDTDTVAAIAGSILGARFGTSWIPLDELADRDRILRYADALITRVPPETGPEYIARETELTERERAYQKGLPALLAASCANALSSGS